VRDLKTENISVVASEFLDNELLPVGAIQNRRLHIREQSLGRVVGVCVRARQEVVRDHPYPACYQGSAKALLRPD